MNAIEMKNVNKEKLNIDLSGTILADIIDIEKKSYLELGVSNNRTYKLINAKYKMGVDINGKAPFKGTTDEYFLNYPEIRYDIVYIDACHDIDYVLRDFNNSTKISNEWIVLHDMIPPTKGRTASISCGDSYKLLYHFFTETNFEFYAMDENFGLTFVRMPAKEVSLSNEVLSLSYEKFIDLIKDKKLYSREEMLNILNA